VLLIPEGSGTCTPNGRGALKMELGTKRGFLWTNVLRLCGAIQ
jgi:hypothetical protein